MYAWGTAKEKVAARDSELGYTDEKRGVTQLKMGRPWCASRRPGVFDPSRARTGAEGEG